MTLTKRDSAARAVVGTVLCAVLPISCGGETLEANSNVVERNGGSDVDDFLPDADLVELGRASVSVVHGRVVSVEPDVLELSGIGHSLLTIQLIENFTASQRHQRGDVRALIMTSMDGGDLGLRPNPVVGDEAVWFLTTLDPQFGIDDAFVLTNQQGLLVVQSGGRVRGNDPETRLGQQLEQLGSIEEVAQVLRQLRD